MLKCNSSQFLALAGWGWEKTQLSLRDKPLEVQPLSNEHKGKKTYNWFVGGWESMDLGGVGVKYDWDILYEIPK